MKIEKNMINVIEITQNNGDIPEVMIGEVDYTLDYSNEFVGGMIDMPSLSEEMYKRNISFIINDEGKFIEGFIPTVAVMSEGECLDLIYGNVMFVGIGSEGETIGLTESQLLYINSSILSKVGVVTIGEASKYTCFVLEM